MVIDCLSVMCEQEFIWFHRRCGGSFNVYGIHNSQGPSYGVD